MEIRAPVGSMYTAKGPWGWFFTGMKSVDATGTACIITDVCGGGGGWKIRVQLPDGTIRETPDFVFSSYPAPPEKKAACYYLFDVTGTATGISFAYRRKGIY